MNSLTRTCHGVTDGRRHGRSRRSRSYQSNSCGTMSVMPKTSPVTAWKALKEGNERFVSGRPIHPSQSVEHRASLTEAQSPTTVVFGCGDSRVAAELIFDQ